MPQLFTNNARALLASGITDTATSLTVEASKADLFPQANTGTGSVPAATNWFKITLQDSSGNVEIVYVRTRTAGSGVMSNLLRGQEGTTARAFDAGTVVGLRITATDVEGSIAAAANSVQLTGDQTIGGIKTFTSQIVANGGVQGNVTGNAGTVTNGVYTTGDQTIGGIKTFSSRVVSSAAVSGAYVSQDDNEAPFFATVSHSGSSYCPVIKIRGTGAANTSTFSLGVLHHTDNTQDGVLHFIQAADANNRAWLFKQTGDFISPGNVTAYSDIRLKTDLRQIPEALAKVKALTGYTYTRTDSGERQTGLVAQDVQRVLPEAVLEGEHLSVAYGNMVGLLVEAIKEQSTLIEDLTARVKELEGR